MKRTVLLMLIFTLCFAFGAPDSADAARRGGFKAPRQSYRTEPAKPADRTARTDAGAAGKGTGAAVGANRGFWSGGSLMRGLMIGGLAGLLFGGLFAGMGGFGNLLGLLVNLLALYLLFAAIRAMVARYRASRRTDDTRRPH